MRKLAERDDVVEDDVGIRRPRAVVELSYLFERRAQATSFVGRAAQTFASSRSFLRSSISFCAMCAGTSS
jgi:hypothetical protein